MALIAVSLFTSVPVATQTNAEKLRISAHAVNMSNIGTGATATVECDIDRWSTERDRTKLISVMQDQGADALLQTLRGQQASNVIELETYAGEPARLQQMKVTPKT